MMENKHGSGETVSKTTGYYLDCYGPRHDEEPDPYAFIIDPSPKAPAMHLGDGCQRPYHYGRPYPPMPTQQNLMAGSGYKIYGHPQRMFGVYNSGEPEALYESRRRDAYMKYLLGERNEVSAEQPGQSYYGKPMHAGDRLYERSTSVSPGYHGAVMRSKFYESYESESESEDSD